MYDPPLTATHCPVVNATLSAELPEHPPAVQTETVPLPVEVEPPLPPPPPLELEHVAIVSPFELAPGHWLENADTHTELIHAPQLLTEVLPALAAVQG